MSDPQNQNSDRIIDNLPNKLHICLFYTQPQLVRAIKQLLNSDRYKIECFTLTEKLISFAIQNKEKIDCIVLTNNSQADLIFQELWQAKVILPTVIIETEESVKHLVNREPTAEASIDITLANSLYHQAEVRLYPIQIQEINSYINLAISKFLSLAPDSTIKCNSTKNESDLEKKAGHSLITQQNRLTNKIKERLGYMGVYYKRNSNDFYRNLATEDREKLISKLTNSYRKILLNYFNESKAINQLIDEFVDRAFFANVSTSQILEIHMDIIDDFSHQLQIEGRNDDILLDYRLPLIDVISHLCEMYRRSIPGENISLELLFGVQ